jgi:hypothetical protein
MGREDQFLLGLTEFLNHAVELVGEDSQFIPTGMHNALIQVSAKGDPASVGRQVGHGAYNKETQADADDDKDDNSNNA